MLSDRATDHFIYNEWLVSDERPDLAKQMSLSELEKVKVFYMANILEPIRKNCNNIPIRVLSGKRTPELNVVIGGVENSDHLFTFEKAATDFCFYWDNFFLWNAYYILKKQYLKFLGQVIIYLYSDNFMIPRFIHFSLVTKKHNGEMLVTIDDKYYTEDTAIKEYPGLKRLLRL